MSESWGDDSDKEVSDVVQDLMPLSTIPTRAHHRSVSVVSPPSVAVDSLNDSPEPRPPSRRRLPKSLAQRSSAPVENIHASLHDEPEDARILVTVHSAENICPESTAASNLSALVLLRHRKGKLEVLKTDTEKGTSTPQWNCSNLIKVPHVIECYYFAVKLYNQDGLGKGKFVGTALIPYAEAKDSISRGWYPVVKSPSYPNLLTNGRVQISIQMFRGKAREQWDQFDSLCRSFKTGSKYFQIDAFYDEETCKDVEVPGTAESVEIVLSGLEVSHGNQMFSGMFYLTNFRVMFITKELSTSLSIRQKKSTLEEPADSFSFCYENIVELKVGTQSEITKNRFRLSKSSSEPYVMKITLHNFREFILFFGGTYLKDSFILSKVLNIILKQKIVLSEEYPNAFELVRKLREIYPGSDTLCNLEKHSLPFDIKKEFEAQNIPSTLRMCELNDSYQLCSSYPKTLLFPSKFTDSDVHASANFRGKNRIPTISYYSDKFKAALSRSGQPQTGLIGKSDESDELLMELLREISSVEDNEFIVFDARSEIAATGNKFKGMGVENVLKYNKTKIIFLNIGNIHSMRGSIDKLRAICISKDIPEESWLSNVENTKWMYHSHMILEASCRVTKHISTTGGSVLVHCSDGWDRTAQICSLSQIMLDARYRTLEGLRIIVEKDFLSFGHKFKDRLGSTGIDEERSPVFFQFLDALRHLVRQFPTCFEYTENMIALLAHNIHSGWFGTFLFNTEEERNKNHIHSESLSIWPFLEHQLLSKPDIYRNSKYDAEGLQVILPISSIRRLELWSDFFLKYDTTPSQLSVYKESSVSIPSGDSTMPFSAFSSPSACISPTNSQCNDCQQKFGILRRKLTCKLCEMSFCKQCIRDKVQLSESNSKLHRVCSSCYKQTCST